MLDEAVKDTLAPSVTDTSAGLLTTTRLGNNDILAKPDIVFVQPDIVLVASTV